LLARLVGAVRDARPEVVVTFGPEGAPNRHADHRAISRLATAAFFLAPNLTMYPDAGTRREPWRPERLYYCSWEEDHPAGPDRPAVRGCPITCTLDIRDHLAAKSRAFDQYQTQQQHRRSFEYTMLPLEHYSLVSGRPQPAPVTDDLFAGF
jgi:LmbE family N-acetylglucosaminyl deacetylase